MSDPVAAQPQPAQKDPWGRQQGENDLWYCRFLRFVALGPSRSMSLLTKGRKNAYPVPAHWPQQASQQSWGSRAKAFDREARVNPQIIVAFNNSLRTFAASATNGEQEALKSVIAAGGYQLPADTDEDFAAHQVTA